MELTAAQRQAVAHDHAVRITGGPGSGKTTTLIERCVRLVGAASTRVVVLTADRAAADRFEYPVLRRLPAPPDGLTITTVYGLAHDLVTRAHPERELHLLTRREHRAAVRTLLSSEAGPDGARYWPTLHHLVGREAFAREVADAVLAHEASLREPSGSARAAELLAFAERLAAILAGRGAFSSAGLVGAAVEVAKHQRARFDHVLVDDYESVTPATEALLAVLGAAGSVVTVAGDADGPMPDNPDAPALAIHLDHCFRRPAPPELVCCRHPSTEAEAIAGELLGAAEAGVPWSEMAVLVRRPRPRAWAVVHALARHGIPVSAPPALLANDPAVRAIVDMFRWATGDASAFSRLVTSPVSRLDRAQVRELRRRARAAGVSLDTMPELAELVRLRDEVAALAVDHHPAHLAHVIFRGALSHLVHEPEQPGDNSDERALDAIVAFVSALDRHAEQHPASRVGDYLSLVDTASIDLEPWQARPGTTDSVTVISVAGARGREWNTVIIAGCVEGEFPDLHAPNRFFDVAETRSSVLIDERRLFRYALARATGRVIATAAPQAGVLLSRFVEAFAVREPRLPSIAVSTPIALHETPGRAPVWPESALQLSATQLETYDDCPLKYAYRYALRVRGPAGIWADFGTLVHGILAEFLDPSVDAPRTRQRLLEIADEHWSDAIAPYQPQREEARRDLYEILDAWWEHEGEAGLAPEVLSVEHRFDIEVAPHRITGSIDRVDRADDGRGIRLVDYKTGRHAPTPEEAAEHLQLATYHLAATRDRELQQWGPPTHLRLLYLRSMETRDQPVGPDHAARTEARVLEAAQRILTEHFEPSVEADCDHCEFHRLCPLQPEGRQVS